jgi:hypothetical protein
MHQGPRRADGPACVRRANIAHGSIVTFLLPLSEGGSPNSGGGESRNSRESCDGSAVRMCFEHAREGGRGGDVGTRRRKIRLYSKLPRQTEKFKGHLLQRSLTRKGHGVTSQNLLVRTQK